jgi:hypothetical protein
VGSRPHPAWTAAALLGLWLLTSLLAYRSWIHGADHRDFYARWTGARLLLFQGRDLYSDETTRQIQQSLYGELRAPGEDQQGFAYPAWVIGPLLPFWLIGDLETATAVWVGFSAAALVGSLMLLRRLVSPPPHPVVIGLLLAWSYTLLMLFQAQFTGIVAAAIAIGIWGSRRGHDRLGGLVASLSLIKPALAVLPLAVLCLLAIRERRPAFLGGLALGVGLLSAVSVILAGWWIPGWIEALRAYSVYAKVSWPIRDAWVSGPLPFAVLTGTILVALVALRRASMLDLAAASIPVGILLLPQTLIWELSILVVPLQLAWRGAGRLGGLAIWVVGWLGLLASGPPEWWKVEMAGVASLTLLVVALSSRRAPERRRPEAVPAQE